MTRSNNLTNTQERLFRRLTLLTVVTIYLLVLAGGIVRSTGSGMGCPDWPRCFGRWIPPTEVSQLPSNYQEIYGAKLKGEITFNAVKTWIEYINRLLGAFSGLLVLGTLLASIPYLRHDAVVFFGSLLALGLIGLNGWLGAKVVSSELAPLIVTLHMLLAIAVVFTLLYVTARSFTSYMNVDSIPTRKGGLNRILIGTIFISLVQVLIGTQVRETLDQVIQQLGYTERYRWIDSLDYSFYIHRSFSLVVLVFHLMLIYQLKKVGASQGVLSSLVRALIGLVVLELLTGIVMAYFAIPSFAQPIHLVLAILIVSVQFVTLLLLNADHLLQNKAIQLPSYLEV